MGDSVIAADGERSGRFAPDAKFYVAPRRSADRRNEGHRQWFEMNITAGKRPKVGGRNRRLFRDECVDGRQSRSTTTKSPFQ